MSTMIPWSTVVWNSYTAIQPQSIPPPPPPPPLQGNMTDMSWFLPVVISSAIVGLIVLVVLIIFIAVCCNSYCKYGYCCEPSVVEEGGGKRRGAARRKVVVDKSTKRKSSTKVRVKRKRQLFVVPEPDISIPGYGLNVDRVVIGTKAIQSGGNGDRVVKRREYITADYDDSENDSQVGRRRNNGPPPSIQIKRQDIENSEGKDGEDITVIVGNRRIVIPGQTASNSSLNVTPQRAVAVQGPQRMKYQQSSAPQEFGAVPYHQQPIQPTSSSFHQQATVFPGDAFFPAQSSSSSNHPLDGGPHSASIQVLRSGGADSIYPNISQSATGNGYYY